MVEPKPKFVVLGCDKRNVYYYGWNNSTYLEDQEKIALDKEK